MVSELERFDLSSNPLGFQPVEMAALRRCYFRDGGYFYLSMYIMSTLKLETDKFDGESDFVGRAQHPAPPSRLLGCCLFSGTYLVPPCSLSTDSSRLLSDGVRELPEK
ncbi:hypothetical protein M9H77_25924 [Catharanthus roseus]|uniref:Uncharacterized protein n=1 Tax=Catharanthus roseus TaxID=4058 RepID=A0ACC0A8M8_CATRO|nr:hypothetical protein M9H77_25924 [Catharanthus roseus]